MTVVDKSAPDQSNTVTLEIDLAHPPSKVWRAITDPELLREWLLPAIGFDLTPGARFTLQGPAMPGWDGKVQCETIDAVPGERLRYKWVVGDLDTTVTFTLSPTSKGTLLSLVQTGFTSSQKQNYAGARYGLRTMGQKLVDLLARVA